MSRHIKLLLGGSIAGLLVVSVLAGLALSGTALAQTPPAGQTKPAGLAENFISKLAATLGITEDKLRGAIKDTQTQIVDEGVQQGKITEDNANKMKERIQNSPNGFGLFGLHAPRLGGKLGPAALGKIGMNQVVSATAQILGMSATDVQTQLRSGQSQAEIAAASPSNMQRQDLINALVTQLSAAIDQHAQNSKLKADQVNKIKDQLPKLIERMVDAKHPAGAKGPRGQKDGSWFQKSGQGQGQQQRFVPGGLFGRGAA